MQCYTFKKPHKKITGKKPKFIDNFEHNNFSNKIVEELKLAIDKDYVNKFWTGCKG